MILKPSLRVDWYGDGSVRVNWEVVTDPEVRARLWDAVSPFTPADFAGDDEHEGVTWRVSKIDRENRVVTYEVAEEGS